MLTPRQIADLRERAPHAFEDGLLVIEGSESNPNVVPNFDAFIDGLKSSDAHEVISKMTDAGTLRALLNHIEAQRFIAEKDGKPLVDANGLPRMEEVQLPAWKLAILTVIQRKLNSISNIQATTDSPE